MEFKPRVARQWDRSWLSPAQTAFTGSQARGFFPISPWKRQTRGCVSSPPQHPPLPAAALTKGGGTLKAEPRRPTRGAVGSHGRPAGTKQTGGDKEQRGARRVPPGQLHPDVGPAPGSRHDASFASGGKTKRRPPRGHPDRPATPCACPAAGGTERSRRPAGSSPQPQHRLPAQGGGSRTPTADSPRPSRRRPALRQRSANKGPSGRRGAATPVPRRGDALAPAG